MYLDISRYTFYLEDEIKLKPLYPNECLIVIPFSYTKCIHVYLKLFPKKIIVIFYS